MTTREKYEALRDERGLSDFEVMKKARIPKATFYTWRARSVGEPLLTMNVPNMRRVADALGVKFDDLIGDVE